MSFDLKDEILLYGVKDGDEDWQEVILSTNPKRFEEIKKLASRDGYGRFRVSVINLNKKPDFIKAILRQSNDK